MPIVIAFPSELAVWQAIVTNQPLSPLSSPSDIAVGNNHIQGMNYSEGYLRAKTLR